MTLSTTSIVHNINRPQHQSSGLITLFSLRDGNRLQRVWFEGPRIYHGLCFSQYIMNKIESDPSNAQKGSPSSREQRRRPKPTQRLRLPAFVV
jgi:hypothetical protein